MKKIRWGILSTAKIGIEKVIPAMQAGELSTVTAIASRNIAQATKAADKLGIPKAYGSYEALLRDADVDAIYIPLPNHLHVPWTLQCMAAGKHVLCEKPIALTAAEAETLQAAIRQYPNIKVMEAFMYRFHPQWILVKKMVDEGSIGTLKTIHSAFSYFNNDPKNIRNQKQIGGGGVMDVGCYNVSLSRFIFGAEPLGVMAVAEIDPVLKTDRLTAGMLTFSTGTATFTCSTQLFPYQRVQIFGTTGVIEMEIPFNAPPDKATRVWLETKDGRKEFLIDAVNQYTSQGDLFSKAILENTAVPTPIEDAVNNMKVIDGIFKSAESGKMEAI